MSLGGFNGSDPYPTLAEFEALVNAGKVHYFIAGGTGGPGGGAGTATATGTNDGGAGTNAATSADGSSMSAISAWVAAHFTSQTVGGITVYDLASRTG